jgi:hypothetical protein
MCCAVIFTTTGALALMPSGRKASTITELLPYNLTQDLLKEDRAGVNHSVDLNMRVWVSYGAIVVHLNGRGVVVQRQHFVAFCIGEPVIMRLTILFGGLVKVDS